MLKYLWCRRDQNFLDFMKAQNCQEIRLEYKSPKNERKIAKELWLSYFYYIFSVSCVTKISKFSSKLTIPKFNSSTHPHFPIPGSYPRNFRFTSRNTDNPSETINRISVTRLHGVAPPNPMPRIYCSPTRSVIHAALVDCLFGLRLSS